MVTPHCQMLSLEWFCKSLPVVTGKSLHIYTLQTKWCLASCYLLGKSWEAVLNLAKSNLKNNNFKKSKISKSTTSLPDYYYCDISWQMYIWFASFGSPLKRQEKLVSLFWSCGEVVECKRSALCSCGCHPPPPPLLLSFSIPACLHSCYRNSPSPNNCTVWQAASATQILYVKYKWSLCFYHRLFLQLPNVLVLVSACTFRGVVLSLLLLWLS